MSLKYGLKSVHGILKYALKATIAKIPKYTNFGSTHGIVNNYGFV